MTRQNNGLNKKVELLNAENEGLRKDGRTLRDEKAEWLQHKKNLEEEIDVLRNAAAHKFHNQAMPTPQQYNGFQSKRLQLAIKEEKD